MGPTGPSAGLNPGPWMGFKSYSGRGGPVGGIIFFPVFCFLFCFIYFVLFLLTTKNLFILFHFVSNYLCILLLLFLFILLLLFLLNLLRFIYCSYYSLFYFILLRFI